MLKITPISFKRLVCIFEKVGFKYSRTKGDHLVYVKAGCARPLVIPKYEEVPVFIIKNLLRTSSIDREKYFSLLPEC